MTEGAEAIPVPGVQAIDHTADLGILVEAQDLPALFLRAALGTMWLVLERPPEKGPGSTADSSGPGPRSVDLVEADLACLFRSWLRSVLFWDQVHGFITTGARLAVLPVPSCGSPDGHAFGLQGTVGGWVDPGPRVREIKGVTLHGLSVERVGSFWRGQVIFDV